MFLDSVLLFYEEFQTTNTELPDSRSVVKSDGQIPSEPGCLLDQVHSWSQPAEVEQIVSSHAFTAFSAWLEVIYHNFSSLLGHVADRGRGEVKVSSLQGA